MVLLVSGNSILVKDKSSADWKTVEAESIFAHPWPTGAVLVVVV